MKGETPSPVTIAFPLSIGQLRLRMIHLKEGIMKSLTVLLESLLDDFRRLEPGTLGLDRDIRTIKRRFKEEGYGFFTVALPNLGKALEQGLSTGRFTCPKGFAKIPRGAIPRLFGGMFCEVFEPETGLLLQDALNTGALKNLRQVLILCKKMTLDEASDVLLDAKAKKSFYSTDEVASRVEIPDRILYLLERVSRCVLPNLDSEDLGMANYKHGPGAVVEGLSSNQKWSGLFKGVLNDSFDLGRFGYDLFAIDLKDVSERVVKALSRLDQTTFEDTATRSIARLISVPKNSTARRTITIEPLLKQFCQQGLNTVLRSNIERCKVLSNCLALTDQSKNQQLAMEGSLLDNWATIDLKSASDLMSQKLVKAVFDSKETFYSLMMECRSSHVQTKEMTFELAKFAGMGNALTFPVQSVVFAVIGICAILDVEGRSPSYGAIKAASRRIRVYGDDIIIRSKYATQVVFWLEQCGLKVNTDKSFLGGYFKESCGVDAFRGVDVTPLYLRHRPDNASLEPSSLQSLVEFSNHMWLNCYYKTAECVRAEVEERLKTSLPLVTRTSHGLGWHTRPNYSEPQKWNRFLHRPETSTYVLEPLKRRDRLDGYAALLKFFHVPLLGRAKDHLEKSAIRFKLRIRRKWVPA